MRKTLFAFAALLLLVASPLVAQTTTTSTTSSAAMTDTDRYVSLAAGTNVAAGSLIYADKEAMLVNSITNAGASATRPEVRRGQRGTAAAAHPSGSTVWVATASTLGSVFQSTGKTGGCTSTSEPYLPQIDLITGRVMTCVGGYWNTMGGPIVGTIEVVCRSGVLFTGSIDQACFTADRPYAVTKITEIHTVKEAGGTLTLLPRKMTGTQAVASGAALGTALDMAAAATVETLRTFTLTATAADLLMVAGDRLGLDFTDDVAGELAGVTVTFTLVPR
jgi:hypothetical protein